MARFNEILVGRFNKALQKVTGIKGAASTPVLASEIVPSFNLFWGAENRFLESWNRFAIFTTVPSGANVSMVSLRNPPGSNVIAVIEKISVSNANASAQEHKIFLDQPAGAGDLTTTVASKILDVRGGPNIASTCIFSSANTFAAVGTAILDAFIPVATTYDFIGTDIQELTLTAASTGSGTRYLIATANTAQILAVSIVWRERFLEESERF